jgi:heat shock protein HslJ
LEDEYISMINRIIIILLSTGVILSGCSISPSPQVTPTIEKQTEIIPDLNGTFWMVTSINGSDLIGGTNITLTFVDGWATGNGGCNNFGGEYAANDEGEINLFFLIRQEVLCMSPPGVMEQEDIFLDILEEVEQYRLVEGKLRLDSRDHYLLLGYLVMTE